MYKLALIASRGETCTSHGWKEPASSRTYFLPHTCFTPTRSQVRSTSGNTCMWLPFPFLTHTHTHTHTHTLTHTHTHTHTPTHSHTHTHTHTHTHSHTHTHTHTQTDKSKCKYTMRLSYGIFLLEVGKTLNSRLT